MTSPTPRDSARVLTDAELAQYLDHSGRVVDAAMNAAFRGDRDDLSSVLRVGVVRTYVVDLVAEVRRLRAAIREHRDVLRDLGALDQYGSDFDLWAVLDDGDE